MEEEIEKITMNGGYNYLTNFNQIKKQIDTLEVDKQYFLNIEWVYNE